MKNNKCLRCGKICGAILCEDCIHLKKCKMCGIVCRPEGKYKVYSYTPEEKVEIIESFCTKLYGVYCDRCNDWEKMIKDECFVCKTEFKNSYKNFKENGNYCPSCNEKSNLCLQLKNVPPVTV